MKETTLNYDNPLNHPEMDILRRNDFSKALAKSIIGLEAREGFVYALYGPWGSGKTTVINFVENHIAAYNQSDSAQSKIVTFKFNPWMFSGSENLTKVFLDQLRIRLKMKDVGKSLKKVVKGLDLIEQGLSLAKPLGTFIPIPGFLEGAKQVISDTKNVTKSASENLTKDLHHIRAEITKVLLEQNDKILVVIDDLDRLFDEEIKEFIKMIKSVCDFPKVIYLLACDSDKVANALDRNGDGYDYLEKIVQCSFNIPRPEKNSLNQLFFESLGRILEPMQHRDQLFSDTEWGNVFHDGVAPCLQTPRNVKSLINSISASYPAVRDEVNVSDFVGIQTLRVFYPRAFMLVENNKELLAGSTENKFNNNQETLLTFYDQLHSVVLPNELEGFKALMSRLFPKYANIVLNGLGYSIGWIGDWKRHRKVCHEGCFEIYFALSIPDNALAITEMKNIINIAGDYNKIRCKLNALVEQDRSKGSQSFRVFLTEFESYTRNIFPKESIPTILQSIYDLSDGAQFYERKGFFEIGVDIQILRICNQLLERYADEQQRFEILKALFSNSKSISLIVGHTTILCNKGQEQDIALITSEHVSELISLALNRIREFADMGSLLKAPRLSFIMYRWRDWANIDEVKHFITSVLENDEGVIDLLLGFMAVSNSIGMTDRVATKHYRVRVTNLKTFLDDESIAELASRSRLILSQNKDISKNSQIAVEAFIDEYDHPENYKDEE